MDNLNESRLETAIMMYGELLHYDWGFLYLTKDNKKMINIKTGQVLLDISEISAGYTLNTYNWQRYIKLKDNVAIVINELDESVTIYNRELQELIKIDNYNNFDHTIYSKRIINTKSVLIELWDNTDFMVSEESVSAPVQVLERVIEIDLNTNKIVKDIGNIVDYTVDSPYSIDPKETHIIYKDDKSETQSVDYRLEPTILL
jgi:hypothetical protein